MANDILIEIDSKNGKHWVIVAEPEQIQPDEGGSQHNGVWKLYVEGDDHLYIGDIAFNQDNSNWVYTGAYLDDDEQEQVAEYIQSNMNGESEPTFYVETYYKGGMANFEIVPNEGHFAVAYDGEIIAEIQHNEDWEQTSGEELDEDVFDTIVQKIESHYE
ncbi:hypothetical protein SNE25_20885 [Mucilaginibacter sabulilitoris]|uniref:Uncharacterized protein n=1 Tax=Mucilaginibacter sabulilitoris TaxID=1173583 RepID=A0ABZ0TGT3_9SPHI|nr:hypothetical protein [Mucilaginibacter sabulilitoris]WPU91776.1 hypothetical protein SNE25_20885 [Mucilaginibacter sabulilitoris]